MHGQVALNTIPAESCSAHEGYFLSSMGNTCVCYEEHVNLEGHTVARADDVESYLACQKLCEHHVDCHFWSHYTGDPSFNTCFLKTKVGKISRKSDDPNSKNYVSGSKSCAMPKTLGNNTHIMQYKRVTLHCLLN